MSAVHSPIAGPRVLPRVILIVVLLLGWGAVALTSAAPAPPVRQLDAAAVARAGLALNWAPAMVGGSRLAVSRERMLAVSPGGLTVVAGAGQPGTGADLVIARADGSQIRLAGWDPLGARFSLDGQVLWAVNLAGALWRIDPVSGAHAEIGAGPYAADLTVAADGSLLAVTVDSVEAPTRSSLVRVESDGSVRSVLPDIRLVYRAFALDNGTVWALVHRPGQETALVALDGTSVTELAVGLDVDVSPDGRYLAWTSAGEVILAAVGGTEEGRSLGAGSSPRFGPAGASLLVRRASASVVLDLDGRLITDLTGWACWAGDGGCQP